MKTGDGAYIKKMNRAIILEKIFENERISRAQLSKLTGLNKATISAQVADLLEEGLLTEEVKEEQHEVGRRPILLSINEDAGYILGIDLECEEIHFALVGLSGQLVKVNSVKLKTVQYEKVLQILAEQIQLFLNDCKDSCFGLASVVVAVHGTVDKDERINFIPKMQWRNIDLKNDLERILALEVHIENNANLSAFAEKVYQYFDSGDLLNLIITSGIGAGMILNDEIYRGYHGYAGESGHMIIYPDGNLCRCGNHGCWELYSSDLRFLRNLSVSLEREKMTALELEKRVIAGDPVVLGEVDKYIKTFAYGLNNVINMFNPELIVITSDILPIIPDAVEKIQANLHSSVSQYRKIVLSQFGRKSCLMGACAYGIQGFLGVHQLVLNADSWNEKMDQVFHVNESH